jgi:hypothetical protein
MTFRALPIQKPIQRISPPQSFKGFFRVSPRRQIQEITTIETEQQSFAATLISVARIEAI